MDTVEKMMYDENLDFGLISETRHTEDEIKDAQWLYSKQDLTQNRNGGTAIRFDAD